MFRETERDRAIESVHFGDTCTRPVLTRASCKYIRVRDVTVLFRVFSHDEFAADWLVINPKTNLHPGPYTLHGGHVGITNQHDHHALSPTEAAVEQIWHIQHSQGQNLALAFRSQFLKRFKLFPLRSEAAPRFRGGKIESRNSNLSTFFFFFITLKPRVE